MWPRQKHLSLPIWHACPEEKVGMPSVLSRSSLEAAKCFDGSVRARDLSGPLKGMTGKQDNMVRLRDELLS